MKCLFFDIASHQAQFACTTEDKIVSFSAPPERIGDAELIPIIESLLKQAGWQYSNLTHVACVIGPGGFTSLRIAVACANTLADQLHIPSVGVHLSELYFEQVQNLKSVTHKPKLLWLHSTKKSELFVRSFGFDTWTDPTHSTIEDFLKQVPNDCEWCGELIEEHQALVQKKGMIQLEIGNWTPGNWFPAFMSNLQFTTDILLPWYGRGW